MIIYHWDIYSIYHLDHLYIPVSWFKSPIDDHQHPAIQAPARRAGLKCERRARCEPATAKGGSQREVSEKMKMADLLTIYGICLWILWALMGFHGILMGLSWRFSQPKAEPP